MASCASVSKLNGVSIGQTKTEVISVMGVPDTIRATENLEFLNYTLYTNAESNACIGLGLITACLMSVMCVRDPNCFVNLVHGKVISYGKVGDFDITKTPEIIIKTQ